MVGEKNRQWVLSSRPETEPSLANFELRDSTVPEPGPNEVLVRTLYLSVDPYMRGRMRDAESYADPWEVGDPMRARSVGEVVRSNYDGLGGGDLVVGNLYWSEYAVVAGDDVDRIDSNIDPPSLALHVLGMPGRTAYVGTVEVGRVKPGDTVVVSAAAGAVGSIAGQIARIAGARVVGIAGSDEKTDWLTDELRFDEAINYRSTEDLGDAIETACPRGVDLYFENVGGSVSDSVFEHLNHFSRVAVCGKIALYNLSDDDPLMRGPRYLHQRKRTKVEGFINGDFDHKFEQMNERLSRWVDEGEIRYAETTTRGIRQAPEAFLGLFEGDNVGKQLVEF